METLDELSQNLSETDNIYTDIIEFDLGTEVEKLKEENELLEDHIDSLKKDIEKLADALRQLKTLQKNLAENISSLFLTAKMELERKDRIIDKLQRELNDIIFRRDKRKRKSLCSSPVNLSKRGRYDNFYKSTDPVNYTENNPNCIRSHEDNNSENVGRDNEFKNDNNKGWRSRVEYHQYDRDDEHNEYKNTARFQPKSHGQNIDGRMKLQYRPENRSSNHDRNKSRDRNDDLYRTRRSVLKTSMTDYKEHWIDESNRKSGKKAEEKFDRCSDDNEHDVQNECSRIPKAETIKLEKEPIMEKANESNTENKKPVRKKLLAVQKLERELLEKTTLAPYAPSEDLSRRKAKSNENRRGNYFVDHMDHIMDTVLLNINEAEIIANSKKERNLNDTPSTVTTCNSYSEDEENLTMNTHNHLSSFKNVPTISHNLASELTDIKKDREKEECVPCHDLSYSLRYSKTDSELVSETMKRNLNENNIKIEEEKSNKIIDVKNYIVSSNDVAAQLVHEKIENSCLLEKKTDQVTINDSSNGMKIGQKLSQISNETLEINRDECLKKNKKSSESFCESRSERNHEKKEGNDISRINEFTEADNAEYVKSQKSQMDEIENTSKDNETARKTADVGGKPDEQSTIVYTEAVRETFLKCDVKEDQETNPLRKSRRKFTPSPTSPKLNSRYKIPKKVKQFIESEPSESNNEDLEAQRNRVLMSIEDHKISYERMHKHTVSIDENIRKSRRKSVPRCFLRQKLEEKDGNIRSKSREPYSRSKHYEEQTEADRQHHRRHSPSRYRIDYQRDNYTRIKHLSIESLKWKQGQERRIRNHEKKHPRMEKRNDINLEDAETELINIKESLCSQRGRKYANYSVKKDNERNNSSKKDRQTIFIEKEKDYDSNTIHKKNKNTIKDEELPKKITETATKINYSVEKQDICKRNPAEQDVIFTTNENNTKIPDSFTKKIIQKTDSNETGEGQFSHENVAASIEGYLNEQKNITTDGSDNLDVKNPPEATPLETTGKLLCTVNRSEKMNTTDSLNEILLKPVSSKIEIDVIENSKKSEIKEKLGEFVENSSQINKRQNEKLPISNISDYSLETNRTKMGSEEVRIVPSIEEIELKASKNSKIRNMPDIFSQEHILPNLIPVKQTLQKDQHVENCVTAKKIQLRNKVTIHYKEVEGVIRKKEEQLQSSETDSLKVLFRVEKSFDTLGEEKDSKNEKIESNLSFPSSSERNIVGSNIPVIPISSSYQETIESSPVPAQTLIRKRITPIRVDDNPLCSFENILVKNRMPSFVKDLTAPNSSPLSLTHDGDIPLLHLEENNFHISNDDGTQKSFDRNIMNLLDTMNMSNLECDMTKFQDSSEKDDKSRGVSDSGPNHKSDNVEVLEPIIEKQTLAPAAKYKAMLSPSTEPPVISTAESTNHCKSINNNVQNNHGDLRTPISNSRQNSSMIGRRRSVRLVVIN